MYQNRNVLLHFKALNEIYSTVTSFCLTQAGFAMPGTSATIENLLQEMQSSVKKLLLPVSWQLILTAQASHQWLKLSGGKNGLESGKEKRWVLSMVPQSLSASQAASSLGQEFNSRLSLLNSLYPQVLFLSPVQGMWLNHDRHKLKHRKVHLNKKKPHYFHRWLSDSITSWFCDSPAHLLFTCMSVTSTIFNNCILSYI